MLLRSTASPTSRVCSFLSERSAAFPTALEARIIAKPLKIVVLYNQPSGSDQPYAASSQDVLDQVDCVQAALGELGYGSSRVSIHGDLQRDLEAIAADAPDVVFNLAESVNDDPRLFPNVAAMLELLHLPFTGSGSFALAATTDKRLCKLALRGAGLPTPDWLVYHDQAHASTQGVPPPWLVKPNFEDASIGIDEHSIYDAEPKLIADLPKLWDAHKRQPLLVEHYVAGREFNLSVLEGPAGLEVLPAAEIDFSRFVPGKPRIVGYRAKWRPDSFEYGNTPRLFHFDDRDPSVPALKRLTKQACEVMGVRGYARVDFRVSRDDAPFILEVNANPCLSADAGFAAAAQAAGLSTAEAIDRILNVALERS